MTITKKFFILLSLFSFCIVMCITPIFANESLDKVANTTTTTITYSRNNPSLHVSSSSNTILPTTNYRVYNADGSFVEHTEWYHYAGYVRFLNTSNTVYAYKVEIKPNSGFTYSYGNCELRLGIGTLGDFSSGDLMIGASPFTSNSFWYINDYANEPIFMTYWTLCDRADNFDNVGLLTNSSIPYLNANVTYTVETTPYSFDDLTDEILQQLTTSNVLSNTMINKLTDLIENTDDLETDLKTVIDILSAVGSTNDQIQNEPDDSSFGSLEDEEEQLKENTITPEEAEQEFDIEINESASGVVWDYVDRFVNAHPAVTTLFISILSVGVIRLIFNR